MNQKVLREVMRYLGKRLRPGKRHAPAGTESWVADHERAAKNMRVSIYARVSTADKSQDPEMQLRELRECCEHRGWTVTGEYVDRGISGTKDSRPELNRLMTDAHRRRFDAVVVWKSDRFARSVSHLLRALENSVRWESSLLATARRSTLRRQSGK